MKKLTEFYSFLKLIVSNRGRNFSYANFIEKLYRNSIPKQATKLANQVLPKTTLISVYAGQQDEGDTYRYDEYGGSAGSSSEQDGFEGKYEHMQSG